MTFWNPRKSQLFHVTRTSFCTHYFKGCVVWIEKVTKYRGKFTKYSPFYPFLTWWTEELEDIKLGLFQLVAPRNRKPRDLRLRDVGMMLLPLTTTSVIYMYWEWLGLRIDESKLILILWHFTRCYSTGEQPVATVKISRLGLHKLKLKVLSKGFLPSFNLFNWLNTGNYSKHWTPRVASCHGAQHEIAPWSRW